MIRLPLRGHYSTPLPPAIVVQAEENGENAITLTIELERGELTGTRRLPDEVARPALAEAHVVYGPYIAYLEACQDILCEQVKAAENETSVWRDLTPEQARALAAMLVHYATEIERRFR